MYIFAKNPDKAKGDASSRDVTLSKDNAGYKNVDTSKNDLNSDSVNIHKNDAVNNNVKDDSSANGSADVKKSKVVVYKSAQAAKEVSEDKKANVDKNVKDVKGDKELKDNKIATDSAEDRAAKDDRAAADSANSGKKDSEVKPNKDGIYDFSNDKNVINPFPNVITPAEVKELQDKTTSVRPLSSI